MNWQKYASPLNPEDFRGRTTAINIICGRLLESQFSSTSVVGGPKTGKTSLLRYLTSKMADQHLPGISSNQRIYIDAEILSVNTDVFQFWISFLRQLRTQNPSLTTAVNAALEKAERQVLNLYHLEDLLDECARNNLRLVVFVDNWDYLLRNTNFWPPASNFLHLVRSFGQRVPRTLSFVVSSKRPLQELWDASRNASPYYNIFVNVEISRLENRELDDLLGAAPFAKAGGVPDAETVDLLQQASQGHPMLSSFLVALYDEAKTAGGTFAAAQIQQEFTDPGGILVSLIGEIRGALTASERQILDLARTAPDRLTVSQRDRLRTLASYGLTPPGLGL